MYEISNDTGTSTRKKTIPENKNSRANGIGVQGKQGKVTLYCFFYLSKTRNGLPNVNKLSLRLTWHKRSALWK